MKLNEDVKIKYIKFDATVSANNRENDFIIPYNFRTDYFIQGT